jgi:hypothetical protein
METPKKSSLEAFLDSTQAYSKTTFELSKLKGLNTSANVLSLLVARLCLLITSIMFLVIISIGLALWLSEYLGKPYYGFFILSALYFITAILFYFFLHNWMKKPFSSLIISQALE